MGFRCKHSFIIILLIVIIVATDVKKKNSIALSEQNDDFFYFLQIRRAKVFHPSIFLSVTAAQGYSELSRFHQFTPEKKSDLLAHNCRLI